VKGGFFKKKKNWGGAWFKSSNKTMLFSAEILGFAHMEVDLLPSFRPSPSCQLILPGNEKHMPVILNVLSVILK
jgi:hypothetical protein